MKKFMLCFHDLSVLNVQKMVPVLYRLKRIAGPFPVLIVPNVKEVSAYDIALFKEALLKLNADGFELSLHGFRHKASESLSRNTFGNIACRLTHGEAEFAGLSQENSMHLLQEALLAWNNLIDVKPKAFIAPTWYGNCFLKNQVLNLHMAFEDRFFITTVKGRRITSPVASFAGIPDSVIPISFLFGKVILQIPDTFHVLPRIALHPVDFLHYEKRIFNLLDYALSKREGALYGDL